MNDADRTNKEVVLDETVRAIRIDLGKERLITVIAKNKWDQERTYFLKVTSKGGLALS